MSIAQAAAAFGVPLPERQPYEKVVANVTCVSVRDYPFSRWTPTLFSCFDDGQGGLSSISLELDAEHHQFAAVLADLTASYGPPVTNTRARLTNIVHDEATWLFPSTEVRLSRMEVAGPSGTTAFLSVTYRPRASAPL